MSGAPADGSVAPPPPPTPPPPSGGGTPAWSSALNVADFASCEAMGVEPVGFVQGCAVMQWSWYTGGYGYYRMPFMNNDGYNEQWVCPHGFVGNDHRQWGFNSEQNWVESAWSTGFGTAYTRAVEDARQQGAHGVIGIVDDMRPIADTGTMEFTIRGTAVRVVGAEPPPTLFTTFLSGQRLVKLLEAGFVPVSVVAAVASVQMIAYCVTHYQMVGMAGGGWSGGVYGVSEIDQVNKAQRAARRLAREHVRAQLGGDVLHGARFNTFEHEIGEGDLAIQCTVRGTRVRQYATAAPLAAPRPVVRLS